MKYTYLNPKIRSMINLLVAGIVGAVLSNILLPVTTHGGVDPNRFLAPLLPMVMGGTALTLFATFTYGVISLANEDETKSRWHILGMMILTLVVAYLFLFFSFGTNGAIN